MNIFLILLAAGDSKRLKYDIPKPFQVVGNKSLLEYSLKSFASFKEIKKTIIVYNKKHKKYLEKIKLKNVIKITGGKSRQDSTFIALKKIKNMNCNKVLIHDVARPNTSKIIIKKIIHHLKNEHAVIPVIKTNDATKRINKNSVFKNIERETLRFSQTPQGFTFNNIYQKHKKELFSPFDDDAALFTENNEKVFIVPGSKENLKITDKEDLNIFRTLKENKKSFGIGFDVHRLVPGKKFYLGGLHIKSSVGTLGHSDGDPVIHAIIDAILGACKMGDIGKLFSNKNKKYKNIRSTMLLKNTIEMIKLQNYFINNIDINIITEKPKIIKYIKKMKKILCKICQININQINIKGKTTEKLGIIGKEKAVASEVILSVIKYD